MEPFFIVGIIYIVLSYCLTTTNADGLLAGYNTLSDERKKLYNIEAIVRVINTTFRYNGIALVLLAGLTYFLKTQFLELLLYIVFVLGIVSILAVNIYTRVKYSTDPIRTYEWILNIVIILFVIGLFAIPLIK